jgi:hypothetical protein
MGLPCVSTPAYGSVIWPAQSKSEFTCIAVAELIVWVLPIYS